MSPAGWIVSPVQPPATRHLMGNIIMVAGLQKNETPSQLNVSPAKRNFELKEASMVMEV